MTLKSIKMPLTILFVIALMHDLFIAFSYFINVYWISVITISHEDGGIGLGVISVFPWGDALFIFLMLLLSTGLGFLAYRAWIPKEKVASLTAIRKPIAIISVLVFIYDLFFIYNTLFHKGWPATKEGEALEGFPFISYWVGEILILLILITFQTGLGILTYRAWVSKPRQPQTT